MLKSRQNIKIIDTGRVDYHHCWDYQAALQKRIIEQKRRNPRLSEHFLLLCEHPHVYTLGKSGSDKNLLLNKEDLDRIGAKFVPINRGGDITYHGPGQLVAYPILNLDLFFTDVHRLIRTLESVVIKLLAEYGIKGKGIEKYTGVWIDSPGNIEKKICAIGIHLSRWVSMHGLALNVNTDLGFYDNIIPCGIDDENKTVTSISREVGGNISMPEVKKNFINYFAEAFECDPK